MAMLLTLDGIIFATSVAKGILRNVSALTIAKHLETLVAKDGIRLTILKRTKDEDQNVKVFQEITNAVKTQGVSTLTSPC